MKAVYLLDVPENAPVLDVARGQAEVSVERVGPYWRLRSPSRIRIDRRAAGVRHAVWFSCVAGLSGGTIVQFDREALCIDAM